MIGEATHEGATEEEIDEKIDALLEPATDAQEEETGEVSGQEEIDEKPEEDSEGEETEEEAGGSTLTLSEIADVFGVDENLLELNEEGKVVFKTKIDGIEGKVSPADALKSYQLEGHLNKQNMEVVNQRKALEAERQQFQQEQTQKIQQLEDTLALAVTQLNHDFQRVDWGSLKVSDPQRYLVLKQEYQDRQAYLQNSYQTLQQARQQETQQRALEFKEKLTTEYQKLRSSVPGWDDDNKFEQGKKEVRDSLISDYGFSDQEINSAIDHRLIKMAHDAMKFRQLEKAKPAVIKKIKQAPKVVKSGPVNQPDAGDLKKSLELIRKSGGEKGLDDYLEKKLKIK